MKINRLTNEQMSGFFRDLAQLLHAGVRTGDALYLLAEDEEDRGYARLLRGMAEKAGEGVPLSGIMEESGSFDNYAVFVTRTGEHSGRLDQTMDSLRSYYEQKVYFSRRLRSVVLYPAALLLVMLCVVVTLLVYVMPIFNDVYAQLGGALNGLAGGLYRFGRSLSRCMPVLIGLLAVLVAALAVFASSEHLRDRTLSFGRRYLKKKSGTDTTAAACFARGLSMGLSSGMTVEQTLKLADQLTADMPGLRKKTERCRQLMEDGAPLPRALAGSGLLSRADCRMLEIGMRGGSGDDVMESIAERLDADSELETDERIGRIEPVMVIISCVLVALILLSVMLPLMNVMTAIG